MNWTALGVMVLATTSSFIIWDAVGMLLTDAEAPLLFKVVWCCLLGAVLSELGVSLRRRSP